MASCCSSFVAGGNNSGLKNYGQGRSSMSKNAFFGVHETIFSMFTVSNMA